MTARTEPTAGGDQETARRSDYSLVVRIATRWNDYDMLGHINNVEYYRYFEIIVLTSLARAGLNWRQDSIIPFTVENHCCFRRPLMPVDTMDGCSYCSHRSF
jgi:acyl-CoA thioester hydrolase